MGYGGFLVGVIAPVTIYLCAFLMVDPLGITRLELFGPPPFNSMQIKEEIIEATPADKVYDGLILGTSSVMTLDLDELGQRRGREIFNYSLFNSRPSHALAAYRHFKRINGVPSEVLIGVDFFAYNDAAPDQEDIVLTRHLRSQVPGSDGFWEYGRAIARNAFSETGAGQLRASLRGHFSKETPSRTIDDRGTLIYHQAQREINAGHYDFRSVLSATSNTDSEFYKTFRSFEKNLRDLNVLTMEIEGDGASFVIVLPAIYLNYDRNLQKLPAYAPFYSQIIGRYGADVIDWRRATGTEVEANFFDARHIRPEFSRMLIRTISRQPAAGTLRPSVRFQGNQLHE